MQQTFNDKAQKVVDYDEYKQKRMAAEDKLYTWKDQLFAAFVDTPVKMFLTVRRGFSEAVAQVKGKPLDGGSYYLDTFNNKFPLKSYFDRDTLEGDIAYFKAHGLGAKFQEKAAAASREAFEASRDFGVLVQTGQFKKFNV